MRGLSSILALADGPEKTAALAAWVQGLYPDEASRPVLVGGAAVELLTGGGYRTGDLDFVGAVPESVERALLAAGFEARGRHWVHAEGEVFLEFPGRELGRGEEAVEIAVGGEVVLVLAPEAVLVDRLAAWEFWKSGTDAASAYLLWRRLGERLDLAKLEALVERREVGAAWRRLREFARGFEVREPTLEELERWAEGS